MGKSLKSRVIFNKRRLYVRNYINKRNILLTCLIATIIGSSIIIISNIALINKANKYTKKYTAKNETVSINENNNIDVYEEHNVIETISSNNNFENEIVDDNKEENTSKNEENKNESISNVQVKKEEKKEDLTKINFTLLGEIMMGGEVTKNLNYIYSSAFKSIHLYTQEADFTYENNS